MAVNFNKVIKAAMKLPVVTVDREPFLRKELAPYLDRETIDKVILYGPKGLVDKKLIDQIANGCIRYQTTAVCSVSALAGLPGGWAMAGTIPADVAQFYGNAIALVDSASRFVVPYQTKVFSRFGIRRGRRHQGVDLPLKTGTPVVAAFDGRVRASTYSKGYGNLVIIRHENGLETFYGHLSKREVEVGDWVRAGDEIGLGGSTGRSTGPHLHFETRYQGYAFDPEWIADYENGELRKNVFVLRRSYLDAHSRYTPESIDEEDEIYADEERIVEEEKRIAAERAAMRYHTVKNGESLSVIARKEGKSLNAIIKLNPGINPDKLSIGQKIRVN